MLINHVEKSKGTIVPGISIVRTKALPSRLETTQQGCREFSRQHCQENSIEVQSPSRNDPSKEKTLGTHENHQEHAHQQEKNG
jgi:hypothetical protein